MDENLIIDIAKDIENYKNKNKENWGEVYEKFLNAHNVAEENKDSVLMNVVSRITLDGFSIEDQPFKLTRF